LRGLLDITYTRLEAAGPALPVLVLCPAHKAVTDQFFQAPQLLHSPALMRVASDDPLCVVPDWPLSARLLGKLMSSIGVDVLPSYR
jgi:hypothetical protein